MFKTYIPKKFCREFVELKRDSLQLPQIMATVKGVKPCTDDWVRVDKYESYRRICRKYGLYVEPDAVFRVIKKYRPIGVIGEERLCTTKAYGFLLSQAKKSDTVHVFIARSKRRLMKAFADGWYPLIIKNRVIDRPVADCYRFGFHIGYPSCCVEFFIKYNNWFRYSYLYEAYRNTARGDYSFLCNPFLKNATYSYIYHMPCSFNCGKTQRFAGNIRNAIYEEEPQFAKKIDTYLCLPVLVFYERKYYIFDGELKNGRIYYRKVFFPDHVSENNQYERLLRAGDCVFIEGRDVVVKKKEKTVSVIHCRENGFAPEHPFIIQCE